MANQNSGEPEFTVNCTAYGIGMEGNPEYGKWVQVTHAPGDSAITITVCDADGSLHKVALFPPFRSLFATAVSAASYHAG